MQNECDSLIKTNFIHVYDNVGIYILRSATSLYIS